MFSPFVPALVVAETVMNVGAPGVISVVKVTTNVTFRERGAVSEKSPFGERRVTPGVIGKVQVRTVPVVWVGQATAVAVVALVAVWAGAGAVLVAVCAGTEAAVVAPEGGEV